MGTDDRAAAWSPLTRWAGRAQASAFRRRPMYGTIGNPCLRRRPASRRRFFMHELPVIATTGAAYRLVLRELPTIFRLSWATLFIVALLQYLLARTVLGQMMAALGRGDIFAAAAIGRDPLWLALKFGTDAVGTAIVAVAIHELVLFDDRRPGQYLHLAFGRREGLFALLGVALACILVPFATIVISPFGEPTTGLAPFFATLALVVAVYVSIRLWPVLPIIVVQERIDVASAWRLTRKK